MTAARSMTVRPPWPRSAVSTIILGIDPGSVRTGYGVIETDGSRQRFLDCGCLWLPTTEDIPARLKLIFEGVSELIRTYSPVELSIEQVFMSKNASSALKLGMARGAAITASVMQGLSVAEYSARQIKLAVVGTGAAEKAQVQFMITRLLGLPEPPQEDAADALAAALCHAHSRQSVLKIDAAVRRTRRGRLRF